MPASVEQQEGGSGECWFFTYTLYYLTLKAMNIYYFNKTGIESQKSPWERKKSSHA